MESRISIRNNKDAYFWISVLPDFKNTDRIPEIKRALRKYFNRETIEPGVRYFNEDYDGVTKVFPFPEYIKTREEAIEYFDDYERIYYHPTYYDCTGQLFTSWRKIFQKPDGSFWCYHGIARDV